MNLGAKQRDSTVGQVYRRRSRFTFGHHLARRYHYLALATEAFPVIILFSLFPVARS